MQPELNVGKLLQDAIDIAIKRMSKVDLLIAGETGVGKSTLVNAVFQGKFATTREITKESIPPTICGVRDRSDSQFKKHHQLDCPCHLSGRKAAKSWPFGGRTRCFLFLSQGSKGESYVRSNNIVSFGR
jgi:GTPase SAR1 family protein